MTEKSRVFYQHPQIDHQEVYSGQLPQVPVPNMNLRVITNYYDRFSAFHFELILRSNVHLSIIRENGRKQIQVAQIVDGKMTVNPCFEHDGFGERAMYFSELQVFIENLVKTERRWIWEE